ncbi:MAG: hypothetical protein KIT79_06005 [Deltaproteobacteria bacterium]|nr:hypothetical protein [Deltaproteobacteria bacterium]
MPSAVLHNSLFQPRLIEEMDRQASPARTVYPEGATDCLRMLGFSDLETVTDAASASSLRFQAIIRSGGDIVALAAEAAPDADEARVRQMALGRGFHRELPWLLIFFKSRLELYSLAAPDPELNYLMVDRRHLARVSGFLGGHCAENGGPWERALLPAAKSSDPATLDHITGDAPLERTLIAGEFLASEVRSLYSRTRKLALKYGHPLLFVVERREFPDRFEEAALPSSPIRPRSLAGEIRFLTGEPGLHAFVTELSRDPGLPRPRALPNPQISFLEIHFAEQLQLLGNDLTLLSIGPTATNRGARNRLELGLSRFRDVANLWLSVRLGARIRPGAIANLIDTLDGETEDFLARVREVQVHIDRLLKKYPVAHIELEVPELYIERGRRRDDPGFHLIAAMPPSRKPARQALVRLAGTPGSPAQPTDDDLMLALLDRHEPMLSAHGRLMVRAAQPSDGTIRKIEELLNLKLYEAPVAGWSEFRRPPVSR